MVPALGAGTICESLRRRHLPKDDLRRRAGTPEESVRSPSPVPAPAMQDNFLSDFEDEVSVQGSDAADAESQLSSESDLNDECAPRRRRDVCGAEVDEDNEVDYGAMDEEEHEEDSGSRVGDAAPRRL